MHVLLLNGVLHSMAWNRDLRVRYDLVTRDGR